MDGTPTKAPKPKFRFNLDEDNVQRILDRRRRSKFTSKLQGDQPGERSRASAAAKKRQELLYIPKEMLVMSKEERMRASQSSQNSEYQNPERWLVPKRKVISAKANLSNEKANIAKRIAREVTNSRATRILTSANQEIGQIGPVRRVKHDPHLQGFLCKN